MTDDGSDFAACLRFLQATISAPHPEDRPICISRDEAKAVCREIMRLQEANALLSGALESAAVDADYIGDD